MSRSSRRGAARATPVALLIGLLCALTCAFTASTASAATSPPRPSPSSSPTPAGLPVTVQVQQVSPEVLRPGDGLTVTVTVQNTGPSPIADPVVTLRINRLRPTTRTELTGWATRSSGAVGSRLTSVHPGPLAPGAQTSVDLTVPASAIGLNNVPTGWGPRGLAVDVTDDVGDLAGSARTFALWLPDGTVPQARVSVLLPLTGPARTPSTADASTGTGTPTPAPAGTSTPSGPTPAPSPSGTGGTGATRVVPSTPEQEALERLTAAGGRLRTVLDLAQTSPDIGLAVDPALVADAEASGPHARRWAADVGADVVDRETFALPWSDPDVAALAHGNGGDLLHAAQQLSAQAGIAGRSVRTDLLWTADGTEVDSSTLAFARTAGAGAVVVGTSSLQSVGPAATTARADVKTAAGPVTALVPDSVLTALLSDPQSVDHGGTAATAVQRALAELAVLTRSGSGEPRDVLVAPTRTWNPDATTAQAVLAALTSSPWSRLEPVSAALGNPDDDSKRTPVPAQAPSKDELAPATVQALVTARATTQAFASITEKPDTLLAGVDDEAITPLSVAWRASPADRAALATRSIQAIDDRRTGLSLAPVSNLNVISASVPYRFVVRNALPVPVTVRIAVHPRKSCLGTATSDPVTVAAGAEESVPVVLHAAANCDVMVDAQVTDLAGQPVGTGAQFTARVAPTVENVGTGVVGGLLAVGLVLGIVRTVRRGQSARRGARRTGEDEAPPLPPLGGEVQPGPGRPS